MIIFTVLAILASVFIIAISIGEFLDNDKESAVNTLCGGVAIILFIYIPFITWIYFHEKENERIQKADELAIPKYSQICDDNKGILSFQVNTFILNRTAIITCNDGVVKEVPFITK